MVQKTFRRTMDLAGREILDVFTYLACLGPKYFEYQVACKLLCREDDPSFDSKKATVAHIVSIENRDLVSWEVGSLLAGVLSEREHVPTRELGEILSCFLQLDLERGFETVVNLARYASPDLALNLGAILLNIVLAASLDDIDNSTANDMVIKALAQLDIPANERTRLFLALSQTLTSQQALETTLESDLFPQTDDDVIQVLNEGNDLALTALVRGILQMDGAREHFMGICKTVMELEPSTGIPLLARLTPILSASEPGILALEATVRGAVLHKVELMFKRSKDVNSWMPKEPDVTVLLLMSLISPGLNEPDRTNLCEWVLDHSMAHTSRLQNGATLIEAIVGAALMHSDPQRVGVIVRRGLLDIAASLRVRVMAVDSPSEEDWDRVRRFERFSAQLGSEFRRRRPLADLLERIMPHMTDLTNVPSADLDIETFLT